MAKPYKPKLIADYEFDEVSSAINKMIRRNKEYEACFWGFVIHQSGYGLYLWRRLVLIASEDIGNASPMTQMLLNALATNWERLHKNNKEATWAKLSLVFQGIQAMCQAKKTREIDNLRNLIGHRFESLGERLEIPSVALDSHCARGRKEFGKFGNYSDGREAERLEHWYKSWCVVKPEAFKGKYLEDLKLVEAKLIKMREGEKQ